MVTTIQLDEKIKERLDQLKIHHRETYNELIERIINTISPKNFDRESLIETIEILSNPETMRELKEALQEEKQGEKGTTLKYIRKEKNQYDEFLHKIQQKKMKELWDNKDDEAWENA